MKFRLTAPYLSGEAGTLLHDSEHLQHRDGTAVLRACSQDNRANISCWAGAVAGSLVLCVFPYRIGKFAFTTSEDVLAEPEIVVMRGGNRSDFPGQALGICL